MNEEKAEQLQRAMRQAETEYKDIIERVQKNPIDGDTLMDLAYVYTMSLHPFHAYQWADNPSQELAGMVELSDEFARFRTFLERFKLVRYTRNKSLNENMK